MRERLRVHSARSSDQPANSSSAAASRARWISRLGMVVSTDTRPAPPGDSTSTADQAVFRVGDAAGRSHTR
jgi:hypothetical protein